MKSKTEIDSDADSDKELCLSLLSKWSLIKGLMEFLDSLSDVEILTIVHGHLSCPLLLLIESGLKLHV